MPIIIWAVIANTKWELTQIPLPLCAHGSIKYLGTLVLWRKMPGPSMVWRFSVLIYLTIFNLNITQLLSHELFWISLTLSGFLSIATYTGRSMFIQYALSLYHCDMDLWALIHSLGIKLSSWYSLHISTRSLISILWCSACDTPFGLSSSWWLDHDALQRSSNLYLDIPVIAPSSTSRKYLLSTTETVILQYHINYENDFTSVHNCSSPMRCNGNESK